MYSRLIDLCYEQVKDNFWYCRFHFFVDIVIDKNTGYFNATETCSSNYKQFKQLSRTKSFQAITDLLKKNKKLDQIRYKVKTETNEILNGTYLHEDLLIYTLCWIDCQMYFDCEPLIPKWYYLKYGTTYSNEYLDELSDYFNVSKLCKEYGRQFNNLFQSTIFKEILRNIDSDLLWENKSIHHLKMNIFRELRVDGTYIHKQIFTYVLWWLIPAQYLIDQKKIKQHYIHEYELRYKPFSLSD